MYIVLEIADSSQSANRALHVGWSGHGDLASCFHVFFVACHGCTAQHRLRARTSVFVLRCIVVHGIGLHSFWCCAGPASVLARVELAFVFYLVQCGSAPV